MEGMIKKRVHIPENVREAAKQVAKDMGITVKEVYMNWANMGRRRYVDPYDGVEFAEIKAKKPYELLEIGNEFAGWLYAQKLVTKVPMEQIMTNLIIIGSEKIK